MKRVMESCDKAFAAGRIVFGEGTVNEEGLPRTSEVLSGIWVEKELTESEERAGNSLR